MNLANAPAAMRTHRKHAKKLSDIVALRVWHHSFAAIARVVGVSRQAVQKAYFKALPPQHRPGHQQSSSE